MSELSSLEKAAVRSERDARQPEPASPRRGARGGLCFVQGQREELGGGEESRGSKEERDVEGEGDVLSKIGVL
eukprot:629655-Rhodomonas_salina.1